MRLSCLAALAAMIAVGAGRADADTWAASGPSGGDVRALAADPRDPRVIYLGTADGVLYRSDDSGQRWQRLTPGFPRRGMSLDDLVVDPATGTLFVGYWEVNGSGGGVARSRDGGRTFEPLSGLQGEAVRALALGPGSPAVLVAGSLTGVFRSDDAGRSWRRISPPGHAEIRNVNSVAIDPRDAAVVYAGTWHLPWKTTDGGLRWHAIRAGMIEDSDVMTMTLDQRDPSRLFATACSGIYRSGDAGLRWSRMRGIPSSSRRTRAFAQDVSRPQSLFAGTTEGLWASEDDGANWRLLTSRELVVNAVVLLPGNVLLLGCDGAGVLRSTDGGQSFAAVNEGFRGRLITRVAVDSASGRVFAGIRHDRRHGGVLTAPSASGPWTALGTGLEGREILSLALAGEGAEQSVLAGTDSGLFLYASHCGVWRRLPTVTDGLLSQPRVTDVAVATARNYAVATPDGLLLTSDGGETWRRHTLGLARSVLAVAAAPSRPRRLAAATSLGIFRSDDAGASFRLVSSGIEGTTIGGLAFLPADPEVLLATTSVGLLRSADGGATWTRQGGGLPLSDITGLAFGPDGRTVFASDFRQGGVYRSADGGLRWKALSASGLEGERVWTLALDARSGAERLLAAASSGGLLELRRESAPLSGSQ